MVDTDSNDSYEDMKRKFIETAVKNKKSRTSFEMEILRYKKDIVDMKMSIRKLKIIFEFYEKKTTRCCYY